LLEQQPVCVLLRGVGTHEKRLCSQQIKSAPPQAPRIDLRRHVGFLLVQFGRPEGLADQSAELNRKLPLLVNTEDNSLAGITDLHLVVTCTLFNV
jgi:hypothetical protein